MIIRQISVNVDDQEKALKFYTEVLGFVRKTDVPMGKGGRFLALASPTDTDGPELVLAANTNSAAKTFQKAMKKAGEPIAAFQVSDVNKEFKRLKKSWALNLRRSPTAPERRSFGRFWMTPAET